MTINVCEHFMSAIDTVQCPTVNVSIVVQAEIAAVHAEAWPEGSYPLLAFLLALRVSGTGKKLQEQNDEDFMVSINA